MYQKDAPRYGVKLSGETICQDPPHIQKANRLMEQGYCRIGTSCHLARIDRKDWIEHLETVSSSEYVSWLDDWERAHRYRKEVSEDRITVEKDVARYVISSTATDAPAIYTPRKGEHQPMNLHTMAALVRPDVTTVSAALGTKGYTFLIATALADTLSVGDLILVNTANGIRVASLEDIHDEPQIDPEDNVDYQWAFGRVPTEEIERQTEITQKIESQLQNKRKQSRREQALALLGIKDPQAFVEQIAGDEYSQSESKED